MDVLFFYARAVSACIYSIAAKKIRRCSAEGMRDGIFFRMIPGIRSMHLKIKAIFLCLIESKNR